MTTLNLPAPSVKQQFAAVKCPHCGRYIGAFVGKAQCKSCSRFVTVVDKERQTE